MDNQLLFTINTRNSLTQEAVDLLNQAYDSATKQRNEYITPLHVLQALIHVKDFREVLECVGNPDSLLEEVNKKLDEMDKIPEGNYSPTPSYHLNQMLDFADTNVDSCGKSDIEISHLIKGMLRLEESWAQYLLFEAINGNEGLFLSLYLGGAEKEDFQDDDEENWDDEIGFGEDWLASEKFGIKENKRNWKQLVICVNDIYKEANPLIGREDELAKTIRTLCRKDKNNPLHIGEPGVGKTALVYGLAAMIEEGKVPEKLKNARIYRMDLGALIAGTQYRGDFEKKIKAIMDGAGKEGNAIIYIDEIHNLVGAGATGESSMDASNILKPYLETGRIRFIGATTYDEYKRYFARNKSIVRRFSNIDILEPSIEETINILKQLQRRYEEFHNVKYTDEAIEFAAKGSAKHLNDRFLPDKAIDLIDESGAQKQIEEGETLEKVVNKELVSKVLAKMCKVESISIAEEDSQNLDTLEERVGSKIFGQDMAVKEVTDSILMSKVGLNDDSKPLASLLFVGPTGVGKTELAKVLAKELGLELLRFDMSEYTEKHTVAKLIGSPAGYVGYEDGGLLTDAIRKTPNSVLLLDEIEKAHPDIYNILLQVMDYARLTDNKGNKADFRNVVVIMTSNAGAQFAAQANVGFASRVSQGDAMLKQVKKTFKPEFLNRLSATVVFNDMSREMASQILDKKLNEVNVKLEAKKLHMNVTDNAKNYLLDKGFTKEYGARELDRIIHKELKRPLMKKLLEDKFGERKELTVDLDKEKGSLCMK